MQFQCLFEQGGLPIKCVELKRLNSRVISANESVFLVWPSNKSASGSFVELTTKSVSTMKKRSIAFEFSTCSCDHLKRPLLSRDVVKCRAFDHTAVDDLDVYQVKVYFETGFQKCGAILSDVLNFLRRAAEIESVVVN